VALTAAAEVVEAAALLEAAELVETAALLVIADVVAGALTVAEAATADEAVLPLVVPPAPAPQALSRAAKPAPAPMAPLQRKSSRRVKGWDTGTSFRQSAEALRER
jgi:hypothetical protein